MSTCCKTCYPMELTKCPASITFNVDSLPDQEIEVVITNIATGRNDVLFTESVSGVVTFNFQDYEIDLMAAQTYKIQLYDEAGTLIEFDKDSESYSCLNLRFEIPYVAEKIAPNY